MGIVSSADQGTYFESLYHDYRPHVLAYCLRRTASAEAADVCSETFLVAWRRVETIPPPPATLSYLYAIAGRVLANHRRSLHGGCASVPG
jgi:RNA polymerase sigma-70 factor (ECF subfamily)